MESTVTLNPDSKPTAPLRNKPTRTQPIAETTSLEVRITQLAAVADLVSRIDSSADLDSACRTLTDRLQEFTKAAVVFVGLCRDGSPQCRIAAISQVGSFHARDEYALAAQGVLQEVIAHGELVVWPATNRGPCGGQLAHRQFASSHSYVTLVSGPLRDANGRLRGAWLLAFDEQTLDGASSVAFLRAAEAPIAAALHLTQRAELSRIDQSIRAVLQLFKESRGRVCAAIGVAIIGILCIPFPFRPRCDCTIEPVTRRYVAAPFDGPLDKAFVEPGDEVTAGELLARMDGREVQWELSGTRAELHRATKERAGHLATHESGQAEMARLEVSRLKMRTELLEHRDKNLEIRSPIAGIVVTGDWKDAEGTPLHVGQAMFEIAPLDGMIVEISVAEDDFLYVQPGMSVAARLDAYPLRSFDATVERVHPRAELRNDENVFIAEVRLNNTDGALRPGMRGSARVKSEWQPLGWILFRRPVNAVIAWLGW